MVGAGGGLDLNNIALYRLSANTPPEAPERVCTYHSADGSTVYADPTFSPRGNAIAFAQDAPGKRADGVYVWSFGNCSGRAKLIARGAVDPDWGPRLADGPVVDHAVVVRDRAAARLREQEEPDHKPHHARRSSGSDRWSGSRCRRP